jgi:HemY protein
MIRILYIFFLLLISVWSGIQISHDPGYVLITINHWRIETTVWVMLLGLLVIFILLHNLLIIYRYCTSLPNRYRQWQTKRRAQKAQVKTHQGLIEFSEGYWAAAKHHLIKAIHHCLII